MGYCTRHRSGEIKELDISSGRRSLNPKSATLDMTEVSLNTEFASPELHRIPCDPAIVAYARKCTSQAKRSC